MTLEWLRTPSGRVAHLAPRLVSEFAKRGAWDYEWTRPIPHPNQELDLDRPASERMPRCALCDHYVTEYFDRALPAARREWAERELAGERERMLAEFERLVDEKATEAPF